MVLKKKAATGSMGYVVMFTMALLMVVLTLYMAQVARKSMVGSGARSEKIRTYNFPQDRVTDHRINYSAHNLPGFMMGNMDDMLDALNVYAKEEQLKADVSELGA